MNTRTTQKILNINYKKKIINFKFFIKICNAIIYQNNKKDLF